MAEVFRQIVDGDDIPQIGHLLKRMTAEQASTSIPGVPYTILTNLEHADFWQRIWLGRLTGGKKPSFKDDWREPDPSEYETIRGSFLANLAKAHEIASSKPFDHKMKSDDVAVKTLIMIPVHDAYHIGQIKLLACMLSTQNSS